jgi:hypothetical protein
MDIQNATITIIRKKKKIIQIHELKKKNYYLGFMD